MRAPLQGVAVCLRPLLGLLLAWVLASCHLSTHTAIDGMELTDEWVEFIEVGKTGYAEVLRRLGFDGLNPPTLISESPRALCFTWTEVSSLRSSFSLTPSLHGDTRSYGDVHGVGVRFDERGRVVAIRSFKDASLEGVHRRVREWLR